MSATQKLRPIGEQVIVVTGASSGIGRETALQAAERGARVVPVARNEEALASLAGEIERIGGQAHPVVADVADWEQVQRVAREAMERFGRIDTWVNNAAVAVYGTVAETPMEDIRRLIEVDLLGQIHGMKAALPHLRTQGSGAIINVASALGKRSVPLQAAYSAAKHGVLGFTEGLRVELERDAPGIAVTAILPSSINTPFFEHARSRLGVEPKPFPPVYAPGTVAEAILFAAEHPRRRITVGGAGKAMEMIERISPALGDRLLRRSGFEQQKTRTPDEGRDNLYDPSSGGGRIAGRFGQHARSTSYYTRYIGRYPGRKAMVALGFATVLLSLAGAAGAALREAADSPRKARPRVRAAGTTGLPDEGQRRP